MCPFWAIGYPCPNLTLKDYCTFTHNRYAKRNETLWIRLNERGHGLSDKIMTRMLTNPHDREAIARNKKLWRSYPKELQEEQKQFIHNVFLRDENRAKWLEIWKRDYEEEEKEDKLLIEEILEDYPSEEIVFKKAAEEIKV